MGEVECVLLEMVHVVAFVSTLVSIAMDASFVPGLMEWIEPNQGRDSYRCCLQDRLPEEERLAIVMMHGEPCKS